jgi:hypothetical protein
MSTRNVPPWYGVSDGPVLRFARAREFVSKRRREDQTTYFFFPRNKKRQAPVHERERERERIRKTSESAPRPSAKTYSFCIEEEEEEEEEEAREKREQKVPFSRDEILRFDDTKRHIIISRTGNRPAHVCQRISIDEFYRYARGFIRGDFAQFFR